MPTIDVDKMKNGQVILNLVLSAALTLLGSVQIWMMNSIVDHGERLAAIQANRFRAEDGLLVWKEIAAIRQDLATVPRENPPQWFVDRVNKLESKLDDLVHDFGDAN
jgi:hypothetical protein